MGLRGPAQHQSGPTTLGLGFEARLALAPPPSFSESGAPALPDDAVTPVLPQGRIRRVRACLDSKKFCAVPVTSNLAAHAWSTKCRRKKN